MLDSNSMLAPRLPLRLVLPVGLIMLVIVLGVLQYRWLGQVSEAERAQLQRSLNQRAREFAQDFDKDIVLAYAWLGVTQQAVEEGLWTSMDAKYERWKRDAPHPDIVKALYFTRRTVDGKRPILERLVAGSGTGEALAWPEYMAPILGEVDGVPARPISVPPTAQLFALGRTSVVESVPALIIPVTQANQTVSTTGNVMMAMQETTGAAVIVELDRAVLTESVLPELVERYFPDSDSSQYHIAVRDSNSEPLYLRGVEDPEAVTAKNADARASFFAAPHLNMTARLIRDGEFTSWQFRTETPVGTKTSNATTSDALPTAGERPSKISIVVAERSSVSALAPDPLMMGVVSGWHIALRHGAGSLDAAVAQARTRNVAISFGILSVLAFGVGIIVVNARRSERLAAQQMDFVATVSHELRTPLAVIRSAAQNLSAGVIDDPTKTKHYGELIETEGRRLTDMVEAVLEFAGLSGQRRALALKAVDVTAIVRDVVDSSSALIAAARVQVDVSIDNEVPLVLGDEEALRRAVSNLLTNALKHGAGGRWVGLSVSRAHTDRRDDVRITVSDRGRGVDTADLPHIFEAFYRGRHAADRQVQGNGLGLSLVSRIVESHGGRVTVASTPEQGATFTIHLPVASGLVEA